MKTSKSQLFAFLVLALAVTISSCKKEDPPVPGPPPPPDSCDSCIYFDGSDIYELVPVAEVTYGDVFYFENGISFKAKHSIGGETAVESVPVEDIDVLLDPFFSGDKLMTNTNTVLLDFTEKGWDCVHIEFDINTTSDYGSGIYNINGEEEVLPDGVVYLTDPAFGQHVIMEGAINTIEWPPGYSYDNLCVTSCDSIYPPPPPLAYCNDFEPFTLSGVLSLTDTEYGDIVLTAFGAQFRLKYEDHLEFDDLLDYGIIDLDAAGYADENVNFSGKGFVFGEVTCQIDFAIFPSANKKVSFDISNNLFEPIDVNEFNVNGAGHGTLPAGITYNYVDLGLAANGETCYRVEITGEINTIEWRGWEIAYDNLCVEEL